MDGAQIGGEKTVQIGGGGGVFDERLAVERNGDGRGRIQFQFGNFLWDSRFRKFVAVQAENGFSVFAFQQIAFGGSFLCREKADAAGGESISETAADLQHDDMTTEGSGERNALRQEGSSSHSPPGIFSQSPL